MKTGPKENSDKARDNATYLMGFNDAMVAMYALREIGVVPALLIIQTKEFKSAITTASEMISNGVDNPDDLSKMSKYVKDLESWLRDMTENI